MTKLYNYEVNVPTVLEDCNTVYNQYADMIFFYKETIIDDQQVTVCFTWSNDEPDQFDVSVYNNEFDYTNEEHQMEFDSYQVNFTGGGFNGGKIVKYDQVDSFLNQLVTEGKIGNSVEDNIDNLLAQLQGR